MWNYVVKNLGSARATSYIYLNPVITMIASSIIINEVITVFAIGGATLIITGLVLAGSKR
jgi:drug/metabolite transporter (DMT)-like permease